MDRRLRTWDHRGPTSRHAHPRRGSGQWHRHSEHALVAGNTRSGFATRPCVREKVCDGQRVTVTRLSHSTTRFFFALLPTPDYCCSGLPLSRLWGQHTTCWYYPHGSSAAWQATRRKHPWRWHQPAQCTHGCTWTVVGCVARLGWCSRAPGGPLEVTPSRDCRKWRARPSNTCPTSETVCLLSCRRVQLQPATASHYQGYSML